MYTVSSLASPNYCQGWEWRNGLRSPSIIRGPPTSVIKALMLLDLPIGLCWVHQGNMPKTCPLNIQMTQFMLELMLSLHLTLVKMGFQGAMHLQPVEWLTNVLSTAAARDPPPVSYMNLYKQQQLSSMINIGIANKY